MKAKSFVASLILFLPSVLLPQKNLNEIKNSYWSLSYSIGISGTILIVRYSTMTHQKLYII